MAAFASDGILDGTPLKIAECTQATACSAQPTSIAEIDTYALAQVALTPGDGNDFTIANGDTNGRKVTVAQKADVAITDNGTANHMALDDGVKFIVTTVTPKALTSGDTTTFPAWDSEIADPVAA